MAFFGAYPWWTPEQVEFQKKTAEFLDTLVEEEAKSRWTREFPFELYEKIGATGMTGAAIPKEYGGLGLGATGSCIVAEECWKRFPGIGRIVVGNFNGGLRQVYEHGTEEQKKRMLPPIAGGEIGAVAITEVTAGTDAAGISLQARLSDDGKYYILNGRKRFIVGAGVAKRYFIYAQTSFDPADIKKHKHLSAFIIHSDLEGFHSEKVNEILGFENVQNGSLYLKDVKVPVEDRLGAEGEGWAILMGGMNFERTNISATMCGLHRGIMQYMIDYPSRRVQFGKPTIDVPANQDKIADIVMRAKLLRDSVFVTAYKWDLDMDITIDASAVKGIAAQLALQSGDDATQVLGGDGINRFYPVQNWFELGKADHIAGGTVEACKLTVFRMAQKKMKEDTTMPRRYLDPELRVPIPTYKPVESKKPATAENLLELLAENYLINPGLHMTPGDIMLYLDADAEKVEALITELEQAGDAHTVRNRKTNLATLVAATYPGLDKAHDREWYEWYPDYVTKDPRRTF
ncbi:MAG: acyl-CoA/acyl-ACP dehydrogenase [Clostridia bacterium]|nr:acyl-CoA/acyl-ACP dehydrogenase [Clostridia bacterium]